jgi:hypothetical protein
MFEADVDQAEMRGRDAAVVDGCAVGAKCAESAQIAEGWAGIRWRR